MNDIHVSEDKAYTLSEVIDAVKLTLDGVSKHSAHNHLQYSSTDVYWLLHDMLQYVNRNVPGEFILHQIKKGVYRVKYTAEDSAKRSFQQETQRRGKPNRKLSRRTNRQATLVGRKRIITYPRMP